MAAGVFAVLTPLATASPLSLFLVIVWATRYVSLGSIAATLALPPAAWMTGEPRGRRDRGGRHRRADPVPPPRQHPPPARRHRAAHGRSRMIERVATSPASRCSARAAGAPRWPCISARIGHDVRALGARRRARRTRSNGRGGTRAISPDVDIPRAGAADVGSARRGRRRGVSWSSRVPSHGLRAVVPRGGALARAGRGSDQRGEGPRSRDRSRACRR